MPRMDEEKLHTRKFQLKGSGGNTRCKLLQKRFTGKTTERSKHLRHIAIEKDILPQLKYIFQISLKYINLVIPKILFILVLYSFDLIRIKQIGSSKTVDGFQILLCFFIIHIQPICERFFFSFISILIFFT